MMYFIDKNGNKKQTKYIKKVVVQEPDKKGNMKDVKYVEVLIIGKKFEWKNFIPYEEFLENNPRKKIMVYDESTSN